jgi:ketosteroid isomerase-like protein
MPGHEEETSHRLGRRFVDIFNRRDASALEQQFHPDFHWHIAVTDHGDPAMRPLRSKLVHGMNLPWDKSIYDKSETI